MAGGAAAAAAHRGVRVRRLLSASADAAAPAVDRSAFAAREALLQRGRRNELHGISTALLELQHVLDSSDAPLSRAALDVMGAFEGVINSTASGRALRTLGHGRRGEQASAALRSLSSRGLAALTELPGTPFPVVESDVTVDGVLMGRSVARNVSAVLLHMLLCATRRNFESRPYVETRGTGGAAERTFSGFFSTDACARVEDEMRTRVGAIAAATGLEPTLLALVSSSDVTTLQSTSAVDKSYDVFTLFAANFYGGWEGLHATRGLWALLPAMHNPYNAQSEAVAYAAFSARAAQVHHAVRDSLVLQLKALERGFLFEIAPGCVRWFVPRLCGRTGDHPLMQLDLGLFTTPNARSPCRFTVMRGIARLRARLPAQRTLSSIRSAASLVRPALGFRSAAAQLVRREIAAAGDLGVSVMGRVPWCLTTAAYSISAHSTDVLLGALDVLHPLCAGIAKMLVKVGRRSCEAAGTKAALLSRIDALFSFNDGVTSFRAPCASSLVKRVDVTVYADLLCVLPGLLHGLVADNVWRPIAHAALMFSRFYMAVTQSSFSATAVADLERLGRALLRAVRVFPAAAKMIKPSMLLHYARLVRVFGAAVKLCTTKTESFHRVVKQLVKVVAPGRTPEEQRRLRLRMLQRHALQKAVALVVRTDTERRAAGSLVALNLAGRPPADPPKALPHVYPASGDDELASLGGSVSHAWRDAVRDEVPRGPYTRRGARVRTSKGVAVTFSDSAVATPSWLSALARHVLVHAGLAPEHDSTAETVAARRLSITRLSSQTWWDGPALSLSNFVGAALIKSGAVRLCEAACVRVHDTVHLRTRAASNARDAPALRVGDGQRRFVSALCALGHPRAPADEMFVVGELCALLTIPRLSASVDATTYAVLHFAEPRVIAGLFSDVPAAVGLLEPWTLLSATAHDSYSLVEVSVIIRREHVQPRFTGASAVPDGRLWRHPEGGLQGRPGLPPPVQGGMDGDVSDDDDDGDGDDDAAGDDAASGGGSDSD